MRGFVKIGETAIVGKSSDGGTQRGRHFLMLTVLASMVSSKATNPRFPRLTSFSPSLSKTHTDAASSGCRRCWAKKRAQAKFRSNRVAV